MLARCSVSVSVSPGTRRRRRSTSMATAPIRAATSSVSPTPTRYAPRSAPASCGSRRLARCVLIMPTCCRRRRTTGRNRSGSALRRTSDDQVPVLALCAGRRRTRCDKANNRSTRSSGWTVVASRPNERLTVSPNSEKIRDPLGAGAPHVREREAWHPAALRSRCYYRSIGRRLGLAEWRGLRAGYEMCRCARSALYVRTRPARDRLWRKRAIIGSNGALVSALKLRLDQGAEISVPMKTGRGYETRSMSRRETHPICRGWLLPSPPCRPGGGS